MLKIFFGETRRRERGLEGAELWRAATAPSWRSVLSPSDMQTPLQAPICLHGPNQETRDKAKLRSVDFPPGSLERVAVVGGGGEGGRSGGLTADLRNKALTQKSAGCTSQPSEKKGSPAPQTKGAVASLGRIRRGRSPADTLLTRGHRWLSAGHNPWELPTPRGRARPPTGPPAPAVAGTPPWWRGGGGGVWNKR